MYPYLGFLLREARVATIDGGKAELARLGGGVAQAVMRLLFQAYSDPQILRHVAAVLGN
ncbi:MAG: hypothetical protein ABSB94_17475 [Syntrophorhabdales bacterium]|jgi:hypothetical protein